jgi:hypothetical protein
LICCCTRSISFRSASDVVMFACVRLYGKRSYSLKIFRCLGA